MKSLLKKFTNIKKLLTIKTEKKIIVFFSEGKNYRNYLLSVIESVALEKKFKVVYVTSDENDSVKFVSDVDIFFVGTGLFRLLFFTLIKCDFFITSLSNLNNNIKVSKRCKNLIYIPHSLCSTHKVYEKKAFEHYDIFFSTGNYQKSELEKAENIYGFKKKKIFNVGYPYLERLEKPKEINKANENSKKNSVIFAPSWQRNTENLFDDYGYQVIQKLLEKNYLVTLRVHPETLKRSKKTIKFIMTKFGANKNFTINTDLQNLKCFEQSEILISDNGGVALEFVYFYKKPVLFINYREKIQNLNYKEISDETFEDNFRKNYCRNMHISLLNEIDIEIQKIKAMDINQIAESVSFINNNIYQKGSASENIREIIKNL